MMYGVFSDPVAYVRGSISFPNKTHMNNVYTFLYLVGFDEYILVEIKKVHTYIHLSSEHYCNEKYGSRK